MVQGTLNKGLVELRGLWGGGKEGVEAPVGAGTEKGRGTPGVEQRAPVKRKGPSEPQEYVKLATEKGNSRHTVEGVT